jgi:CheY-like chemotaxis protein
LLISATVSISILAPIDEECSPISISQHSCLAGGKYQLSLSERNMPDLKASVLIVEDEEFLRTSLVQIFTVLGHRVRCASDGLAGLMEMRREIPEILLSDLNMPGMSGFELLSVVPRRFPAIRVIAMSGAFSGTVVPYGVTADAFYEKGGSVAALLKAIESLPFINRQCGEAPEVIWIQGNGHDIKGRSL